VLDVPHPFSFRLLCRKALHTPFLGIKPVSGCSRCMRIPRAQSSPQSRMLDLALLEPPFLTTATRQAPTLGRPKQLASRINQNCTPRL
jgi:hypothetical protein